MVAPRHCRKRLNWSLRAAYRRSDRRISVTRLGQGNRDEGIFCPPIAGGSHSLAPGGNRKTYDLARFTLGQKEMRGPEYTRINPNGRVPTLVDGNTTITESTAIAQYLGAKYAPELTPGPDAANFATYLQWLNYAEGMIMPPINNYVVETILLPPERRNAEIAARSLKLLNRTLGAAEAHMKGGSSSRATLPSPTRLPVMPSSCPAVCLTSAPMGQAGVFS